MLKRLFFCFLTILLYGCSEGTKDLAEVYFGLYCGECYRNCSIIIKLDENRGLADTSRTFFKWHFNQDSIDKYVFPDSIAVEISNSNFVRISQLFKFLPSNLDTAKREIGCPDCRDQCGIYYANSTNYWKIDPDHKGELATFIDFTSIYSELVLEEIVNKR